MSGICPTQDININRHIHNRSHFTTFLICTIVNSTYCAVFQDSRVVQNCKCQYGDRPKGVSNIKNNIVILFDEIKQDVKKVGLSLLRIQIGGNAYFFYVYRNVHKLFGQNRLKAIIWIPVYGASLIRQENRDSATVAELIFAEFKISSLYIFVFFICPLITQLIINFVINVSPKE